MLNYEYCAYTYRHRKALMYLIEKKIIEPELKKKMIEKAKVHDMDKMFLYKFLPKKVASKYHKEHASHHMENDLPKTFEDKVEAVFDYECAAYTKPDKPLNAYDTILKYKPELFDKLIDILKKFGMDSSYTVLDDKDGIAYMMNFKYVSEEDINNEIDEYLKTISAEDFQRLIDFVNNYKR